MYAPDLGRHVHKLIGRRRRSAEIDAKDMPFSRGHVVRDLACVAHIRRCPIEAMFPACVIWPDQPDDGLGVLTCGPVGPHFRELLIQAPQHGLHMARMAQYLTVVHEPDVDDVHTHLGEPGSGPGHGVHDDEAALSRAQWIALLGSAVHVHHIPAWEYDGHGLLMAPSCPRRPIRRMTIYRAPDAVPLQVRECIGDVDVNHG